MIKLPLFALTSALHDFYTLFPSPLTRLQHGLGQNLLSKIDPKDMTLEQLAGIFTEGNKGNEDANFNL